MAIQNSRLLRWAANLLYSANLSGNAWRDGASPTKIEPSAGDLAEGFAHDIDTRAETMNWLMNQHDVLRNELVIDRLTQFGRQVNVGLDRVPAIYSNAGAWENQQFPNPDASECVSGVFSERLHCLQHLFATTQSVTRRTLSGEVLQLVAVTGGVAGVYSRGAYVAGPAAASSFSCWLNVGGANRVTSLADSSTALINSLSVAGHTTVDAEPIAIAGTSPTNGVLYFLSETGANVFINIWTPGVGTGAVTVVNTGLGVGLAPTLHRLPSGRLWVTTTTRAAYSDNNGATWAFDGAAAGASQGTHCVYDRDNARWIRFRSTGGSTEVRIAANPNNPTASVAVKTIADVVLAQRPILFGRYVYAAIQYLSRDITVCMSADYGLTWALSNAVLQKMHTDEGTVGTPIVGAAMNGLSLSSNPHNVVVGGSTAVRGWRMVALRPLGDPSAAGSYA